MMPFSEANASKIVLEATLLISILLQVIASILALRLIKIAGGRKAWILISFAVGAMALRRSITLAGIWWGEVAQKTVPADTLVAELVALCTSALLLVGIAAIAPQVSKLKRTERALRESKETLDAIIAASPVGLGLVREGHMEWANQPMLDMFGYEQEQWAGLPAQIAFANQKHYHEVDKEMIKSLTSRGSAFTDCQLVTRQGKPFYAYLQARPLDINDFSKGMIFAVTDITERKKTQTALLESQEKYRLVVENANDAIFILQNDKIQFPNSRARQILERNIDKFEGVPYIALVHPEDQAALFRGLRDAVTTGQGLENFQHRLAPLSGQVRWVDINAVPIGWQGRSALLCFVRDLSSQKKMERQFLQAQKMEALGRLAGGVAHDFNNLLQVISGYSELISKNLSPDDPSYEHITNVIESARRASRLTNQLLTFSREHLTESQEIDLNELVSGMEQLLRRIIGEDILLETSLRSGLGYINADMGQIEQVIMNLVVNARDAMPRGGKLRIETELLSFKPGEVPEELDIEPGMYNVLSISDTGCGMSQEVMSHLFEPFFTTKGENKGTGLGLSTAYGIVKTIGGEITVESSLVTGSLFRIFLPSTVRRLKPLKPRVGISSILPSGTETLLLVEDEEQVRNLLAESLRLNGYKVMTAANGEEALALLNDTKDKVNLIITDVVMPKMSGPQLAKQIKERCPSAKVLFISGYTDKAEIPHHPLGDGKYFLQKPFTVKSLQQKVREVLCAPTW